MLAVARNYGVLLASRFCWRAGEYFLRSRKRLINKAKREKKLELAVLKVGLVVIREVHYDHR